jgi:hypothetical protein
MTNQLTVRIDVENGIAVVSRSAIAGQGAITIQDSVVRGAAHRSWGLALAAAAGSQLLAVTAAASHTPGHEEQENIANPIVYPELVYGVMAGLVVGVITGVVTGILVTRALSANLKK